MKFWLGKLFALTALGAAAGFGAAAWIAHADRTATISSIASMAPEAATATATATATARINALRSFVHRNTRHSMDDEFARIGGDRSLMLASFRDTLTGARADPTPAECSTRGMIMQTVLQHWGFRTRTIYVYAASKNFDSHTFLDVLNPDTGRWESHDPAYDVAWRDAASGAPVSIAEAAGDLAAIEPCSDRGCGYHLKSPEGSSIKTRAEGYFELIAVYDKTADKRFTLYTPRADAAKTVERDGRQLTFCETHPKNCRDGFIAIAAPGPHRRSESAARD